MAIDKAVDSGQLDSDLTSVANAIRTKGGTSAQLAFPNGFVSAVNDLPVPVTPTIQSLTVTPTTSQQTFDSSSVDGYKPVTVNAMPSGSAGTPTATKGAVSDHSVSVTPSVTNTTGYITGSTKTGTAVTVSASELVSGSETKTANGTYDVTNLAELIVNVSGGGGSGLVYETGEITPTADSATLTISYSNAHTNRPFYALIVDSSSSLASTGSMLYNGVMSVYDTFSFGVPTTSSTTNYGRANFYYKTSGGGTAGGSNFSSINGTSNTSVEYFLTNTQFKPHSVNSQYFRSGRTYKWIAVWAPTS